MFAEIGRRLDENSFILREIRQESRDASVRVSTLERDHVELKTRVERAATALGMDAGAMTLASFRWYVGISLASVGATVAFLRFIGVIK